MSEVFISGSGAFYPGEPVRNEELQSIFGTADETEARLGKIILRNNGIRSRHYCINKNDGKITHSNAQITALAVQNLAATSDFELSSLQILACGTSSPDVFLPGHAQMVHGQLGLPELETFSLAGICSASISALKVCFLNTLSGASEYAIATGSEQASTNFRNRKFSSKTNLNSDAKFVENPKLGFEQEFLKWMLSDGAAALLLSNRPRKGLPSFKVHWIEGYSFAGEFSTCMYAGMKKDAEGRERFWRENSNLSDVIDNGYLNLHQDVKLLGENIVSVTAGRVIAKIMKKFDLKPDRIDHFLPHYSSHYFREPLFKTLKDESFEIPFEKWFTNLYTKGNMGSASILSILDDFIKENHAKVGDNILCFIPESGRFTGYFMLLTRVT